MNPPALQLDGVSAGYRDRSVLNQLTLRINVGERVGILGPNGAGKTTLLRSITGLCPHQSGRIRLFDRDADSLSATDRSQLVAVVPQSVETPMPFSVGEMVMMGRTARLSPWQGPTPDDRSAVERAVAAADLFDLKERPITALSAGERQRTLVAMALAQEPRMILLDEATSHLDLNHRVDILHILATLNHDRGTTIVMVSHDLNLTADFCSRIILMEQGRIAADGPPADVLTESILSKVYRCDIRVSRDPASGSFVVAPLMKPL